VITAEPGHKLRALRAGARDFVSKPLDMPEVLIRVHNMIEIRLLRLESELLHVQLVDAQNAQKLATVDAQNLAGVDAQNLASMDGQKLAS